MMKSPPAASFKMTQTEFLFQLFIVPLDDPAMFGEVDQFGQRQCRPAAWKTSIWWARFLLSAIRSEAILPDAVRARQ